MRQVVPERLERAQKVRILNLTEPAWLQPLLSHGHIVEMYLYEVGSQLSPKGDESLLRLELLHSCLLSAKAFFDGLFSTPANTLMISIYTQWAHLIHAIAVLSKLSLLEDADWDLAHARQVLDFVQVVDRVSALTKEFEVEIELPKMFARIVSQMTHLKERYLSRLAILESKAASRSCVVDDTVQVNNLLFHGELFKGLDDFPWQDIIWDWNEFPDPL